MRALSSVIIVALLAATLTACGPSPSDGAHGLSSSQLESVGIDIVESEADLASTPTRYTITAVQADRLIAEANLGGGILGSDLDALAPVAEGMPPTSYLVAAYVSNNDLPGAKIAATLFPDATDWTQAPNLVFPTAVLALMVADLMDAASHDDSFVAGPGAAGAVGPSAATAMFAGPLDTPCSTVTNFIQSAITGLFDVLRTVPKFINTIFGESIFGIVLTVLANAAIDLAQKAVEALVKVVSAEVLSAIRLAITAIGVASIVLSYFKNETLTVTPSAPEYLFDITPGTGTEGSFTATPIALTKDWPPALVDCAKVTAVKLPELVKPGAPANWTITSDLIFADSLVTTVAEDKTAKLDFVTGVEDPETALGDSVKNAAVVTVTIPRKEFSEFMQYAINEIENVKANIYTKFPPPFDTAAKAVIDTLFGPIVTEAQAAATAATSSAFGLKGTGTTAVIFHLRKPKPTPTPTAEAYDNFCVQFNEQVTIAAADLSGSADLFAWGGRFAAGLDTITATPPPALADDFATVRDFYTLVGNTVFPDVQPIADFQEARDVDSARITLWGACGSPTLDAGF